MEGRTGAPQGVCGCVVGKVLSSSLPAATGPGESKENTEIAHLKKHSNFFIDDFAAKNFTKCFAQST